jgi:hypothetical protein
MEMAILDVWKKEKLLEKNLKNNDHLYSNLNPVR